jgi:hypothetical protein
MRSQEVIRENHERQFNKYVRGTRNKQMSGRVISIDYELPGGKRLDDTWGDKVVTALDRLGISAEYDGGEVRADQQSIAGREASSIQFTTARSVDDPDVIAFTAMFTQGS